MNKRGKCQVHTWQAIASYLKHLLLCYLLPYLSYPLLNSGMYWLLKHAYLNVYKRSSSCCWITFRFLLSDQNFVRHTIYIERSITRLVVTSRPIVHILYQQLTIWPTQANWTWLYHYYNLTDHLCIFHSFAVINNHCFSQLLNLFYQNSRSKWRRCKICRYIFNLMDISND